MRAKVTLFLELAEYVRPDLLRSRIAQASAQSVEGLRVYQTRAEVEGQPPNLITTTKMAYLLGVSVWQVGKAKQAGAITPVGVGRQGAELYDRSAIPAAKAWIDSRRGYTRLDEAVRARCESILSKVRAAEAEHGPLLTIREAAELLRVTKSAVHYYRDTGRLTPVKIPGVPYNVFRRAEVESLPGRRLTYEQAGKARHYLMLERLAAMSEEERAEFYRTRSERAKAAAAARKAAREQKAAAVADRVDVTAYVAPVLAARAAGYAFRLAFHRASETYKTFAPSEPLGPGYEIVCSYERRLNGIGWVVSIPSVLAPYLRPVAQKLKLHEEKKIAEYVAEHGHHQDAVARSAAPSGLRRGGGKPAAHGNAVDRGAQQRRSSSEQEATR